MKIRDFIFFGSLFTMPTFVYGACSVANLTRCLDSVCAINVGANPAARCQYCGSASAGEPSKSTTMKSISAGAFAKYTISDKELKKAPSDPGERYVWGTKLCLQKVSGCTPDDVTDNYDSLVEQSCKAAGNPVILHERFTFRLTFFLRHRHLRIMIQKRFRIIG